MIASLLRCSCVSVTLSNITQLVLSHNKLTGKRCRLQTVILNVFLLLLSLGLAVPPNISELKNLEVLNMFNNQIEELPTQISSLQKLKHLNLGSVSCFSAQPLLSAASTSFPACGYTFSDGDRQQHISTRFTLGMNVCVCVCVCE